MDDEVIKFSSSNQVIKTKFKNSDSTFKQKSDTSTVTQTDLNIVEDRLNKKIADTNDRIDEVEEDVSELNQAVETLEETKQDKLTAGKNIAIEKDEETGETIISATVEASDELIDNVTIVKDENNKISVTKDFRGSYLNVENMYEMQHLDPRLLKVGTKCYVRNECYYYTWNGDQWTDEGEGDTFDRYATEDKAGTVKIGENLKKDESGKLVVDVENDYEHAEGSTKPISAGTVFDVLGDIKTIVDRI